MAHAAHAQQGDHGGDGHHIHPASYYVKIWGILLVLLVISVLGPELGHKVVTLITAFGVALIKALMVAAYFMHLNVEKRYIWYVILSMLLLLGLFYAGVAADINNPEGRNWINKAAYSHMEEHKAPAADQHD